jgi:hypothetical protein
MPQLLQSADTWQYRPARFERPRPELVPLAPTVEAPAAAARTIRTGEAVFFEGDAADFVFEIVSGLVRTSKLLADGMGAKPAVSFEDRLYSFGDGSPNLEIIAAQQSASPLMVIRKNSTPPMTRAANAFAVMRWRDIARCSPSSRPFGAAWRSVILAAVRTRVTHLRRGGVRAPASGCRKGAGRANGARPERPSGQPGRRPADQKGRA